MNRILFLQIFLLFITRFHSANTQSCPCTFDGNILRCSAIENTLSINTDLCNTTGINSINVVYSGATVLKLTASTTIPITINRNDTNSSSTLQIGTINTNASRIEVRIYFETSQFLRTLFIPDCTINAPTSTLSIVATQNNTDPSRFNAFNNPNPGNLNLANYEFILNSIGAPGGSLSFPSLVYGLKNLTSITIIGANQMLTVNRTTMPAAINVNKLSLKKLVLNDQILYNIMNLEIYSIEECTYGEKSSFLNSTPSINVSVVMKNNIPTDLVLPFGNSAFKAGIKLIDLTLIEPRLNSTSLTAIVDLTAPAKLVLELEKYDRAGMENWMAYKPLLWYLTIRNIPTLDIFPPGFFNAFHAIHQTTLQGSFKLDRSAICIFIGINRQSDAGNEILILNSTISRPSSDWDNCTDTYVKAINYKSISDIKCPGRDSCEDCERWAKETEECNLVTQENKCSNSTWNGGKNFRYDNSYLYHFFQNKSWLITPSRTPATPKPDSINIGAIVGAVCGLLVAAIILAITVYCIYRKRQRHSSENVSAPRIEKYKPSAHDNTHLSIATSKSSQTSRYALEKSFFPIVQSTDEIAPPLYMAPSESGATTSAYNAPSAPPAPSTRRDSVSTRATHVYETLDP